MTDQINRNLSDLVNQIIDYSIDQASQFGAKQENQEKKDYIFRRNVSMEALEKEGAAYFGFIAPDEESSGPYHDLSLVIFPGTKLGEPWLVALGIGSLGFKNDYELAIIPGLRRSFANIINPQNGFLKTSFLDIESKLPKEFTQKIPGIPKTLSTYGKLLPACEILDPTTEEGKEKISAFIAVYSNMRQWATNKNHKQNIQKAIDKCSNKQKVNDEDIVFELIKQRKYVVLQGAPGTGKTRLAQIIADRLNSKTFFTQFHAETSYSDFIFGIKPDVDKENLQYTYNKGIFYQSIEYCQSHPESNTVLIIDEINRANLANILGPIFYLFEYDSDRNDVPVLIGGELSINKIPENFFLIATMNTADRSLAMVDFALRRRFAWYTLYPHIISDGLKKGRIFFESDFKSLDEIFQWYAKTEELVFQPGQSYFIAQNEIGMKNRIRYELYPLINEYLAEGILLSAKEDLMHYFRERLGGEIAP